MKPFAEFLVEVHRRWVWQVGVGFAAGMWAGHRVVVALTAAWGLPAWTPTLAFVLLVPGWPVTVVTTYVQGGVPWLTGRRRTGPEPLTDEEFSARVAAEVAAAKGLTPAEVHRIPRAHPLHRSRVFTWRNALLGGVCAFVFLVSVVVAYLVS